MIKKSLQFVVFLILSFLILIAITNGKVLLKDLGIINDEVYISGTGSMFPTFPKGEGKTDLVRAQETVAWPYMRKFPGGLSIFGFRIFGYTLRRGDIVDFENTKTDDLSKEQYGQPAGFVKRVIALPDDTVKIQDGFVYINGNISKEPYTASPRSTFGGDFLNDCQNLTIPSGKLFVMGDNRKGSLDSRFSLGLINLSDISHVLPLSLQQPYEKNWRKTANDQASALAPTLDPSSFIDLLNQKRSSINISPLKFNQLLSASAKSRAVVIIRTNDFSIEATRSGYTLEKSIADAGYDNIVFAETIARGYYDSAELVENLLAFPDTKKIILNSEYQDIGLSATVGNIDNCPLQLIVVHLGGYKAPNYKKEDIEPWQNLDDNLNQVILSWEKLKNADGVNQDILNKLLTSLYKRKANAEKILYKLNHNLWLTTSEKQMTQDDKNLSSDEEDLIQKLTK